MQIPMHRFTQERRALSPWCRRGLTALGLILAASAGTAAEEPAGTAAAPDSRAMLALLAAPAWVGGRLNDEPAQMLGFWEHTEQAKSLRRTMLLTHWRAAQLPTRRAVPDSVQQLLDMGAPTPELQELGDAYRQALSQALSVDLTPMLGERQSRGGMRWTLTVTNSAHLALAVHKGTRLRMKWGPVEWVAQCESPPRQKSPMAAVDLSPNGRGEIACELLSVGAPAPAGSPQLTWQAPNWRDDQALATAAGQMAAPIERPSLHDRFFRCEDLGNCRAGPAPSTAAASDLAARAPVNLDDTPPAKAVSLAAEVARTPTPPLLSLSGWFWLWLGGMALLTWKADTAVPGALLLLGGGSAATWSVYRFARTMPHDSMAPWFILLLAGGLGILSVLLCIFYAAVVGRWKRRSERE